VIDLVDEAQVEVSIEKWLGVEALVVVIMNFDEEDIIEYEEMIGAPICLGTNSYALENLDLDLKNRATPPARPSTMEPPKWELKALTSHSWYIFLGTNNIFSFIIVVDTDKGKVEALTSAKKLLKGAFGWFIADIIGIPPGICSQEDQTHDGR